MHNPFIGSATGFLEIAGLPHGHTDDLPQDDEGRTRGPALVRRAAVWRGDYQELPLQPFVPPLQVRVYEPGAVLDFVIVNVPPELDSAEIE